MSAERLCFAVELAGDVAPSEFRIIGQGDNATRKGTLVFDEMAASSVLSEFALGGVDLPIDYDHAMADAESRPGERIAAGWFRPEVRDGELWASDVQWTPRGKAAVESREFRYSSLWGDVEMLDKKGKRMRLTRLRNVALTNQPATIGTLPLVASESTGEKMEESALLSLLGASDEAQAVEKIKVSEGIIDDAAVTLGVEPQGVGAAIRALRLRAEAGDAAVAELAEVKEKAKAAAKDATIARLSEEGKLPPALHDWARSQTLESLEVFGAVAPRVVRPGDAEAVVPAVARVELTEEEKIVAKALGLRLADLVKHKQALAAEEI